MADSYFIKRGKKVSGPFSAGQVKKLAKDGKFRDDDGVSNRQDGPWTPTAKAFKKQQEASHRQIATPEAETPATKPSGVARTRQCEDCGQQISKRAAACPQCGAPTNASGESISSTSDSYDRGDHSSQGTWIVEQLDVMAFIVEGAPYESVFENINHSVAQSHSITGAFKRSGTIRGDGNSGIQFIVQVTKTEEGVEFGIDGETPDGPVNFDAFFDPTEAEGWALAAGAALFNSAVNNSAEQTVERDVQLLLYNILSGLDATHLIEEEPSEIYDDDDAWEADVKSSKGRAVGNVSHRKTKSTIDTSTLSEKYTEEFKKIHQSNGSYKGGFNVMAFLFGPLWALSKGLWLHALVVFFAVILSGGILAIPAWIFSGVRGTHVFYLKHVQGQQSVW